jgi:hypothetical protein
MMFDFLLDMEVFRKSLAEQQAVLRDFWKKAGLVLSGSGVELKPIPKKWTALGHNYFSVLFIAAFFRLGIPLSRLRLYARINHCLRSWVTSCDNLLDNELKEMIKTDLPEDATVFKSVHSILVTDRAFVLFLLDALEDGVISRYEMEKLLNVSLSALTASGKQEAAEEGGTDFSMRPEELLYKIHADKTGRLFTSPLEAPESLGDIGGKRAESIRKGLFHFGLGCQILDDLNDIGTDLSRRKYNYLAACVVHGRNKEEKDRLEGLMSLHRTDPDLYRLFPSAFEAAKKEMSDQFDTALRLLRDGGMPFGRTVRTPFVNALMVLFKRPEIVLCLRK